LSDTLEIQGGGEIMDVAALVDSMGGPTRLSADRARRFLPGLLGAFDEANLNTVNRRAMFLAQCGEESGSLRATEEYASGSEYEGRADLGNTHPGDGVRFKGRTFIQITGRHNYAALSEWAHKKGLVPTSTYFVDHPALLASDQYVWLGPVWYWTVARPGLNGMADQGDLEGATRAINGGLNGLEDRRVRWQHCLKMGSQLMGDDDMAGLDDPLPKDWREQRWPDGGAPTDYKGLLRLMYDKVATDLKVDRHDDAQDAKR
jgi:predicted chitinase